MPRQVYCQRHKRDAEGLDFVPWPGELGKRVYANIGKPAWEAWLAHQTMLINENRLSPMDPKHRAFLEEQMEKFLFEGEAARVAGYVPPEPSDGCPSSARSASASTGWIVCTRHGRPATSPIA